MDAEKIFELFMDLKQSMEGLRNEIHSVHTLVSGLDRDRVHTDRRIEELSSNLAAFRTEIKQEIGEETRRVEGVVSAKEAEVDSRTAALEKRVEILEISNEDLSFVRTVSNHARGWLGKVVAGGLIFVTLLGIVALGAAYIGINFG